MRNYTNSLPRKTELTKVKNYIRFRHCWPPDKALYNSYC